MADDVSRSQKREALAAAVLGGTIDDLLELVDKKYLTDEHRDRWSTLRAFMQDHHRKPLQRETKEPMLR